MGKCQREQALRRKVGIGPTLIVRAVPSPARQFQAPPQDTAQARPHPGVVSTKRRPMAMLEIFKPASQRTVHVRDDLRQRVSVMPACFAPQGLAHFLDALLPWPSKATLKVITKKV